MFSISIEDYQCAEMIFDFVSSRIRDFLNEREEDDLSMAEWALHRHSDEFLEWCLTKYNTEILELTQA